MGKIWFQRCSYQHTGGCVLSNLLHNIVFNQLIQKQDFIICIEMLIFAISFYFIFSHKPYIDPAATQIPCLQSFIEMVDVRDIYGDVRENFVDPITVPGLPKRWSRAGDKRHKGMETIQETAPLVGPNSNIVGYESGEDDGVRGVARQDRLGSGEESLIVFSHSDNRHAHQEIHDDDSENVDQQSFSSTDEQDGASIRERKGIK